MPRLPDRTQFGDFHARRVLADTGGQQRQLVLGHHGRGRIVRLGEPGAVVEIAAFHADADAVGVELGGGLRRGFRRDAEGKRPFQRPQCVDAEKRGVQPLAGDRPTLIPRVRQ